MKTNNTITGKQMQSIIALFWTGSIVVAGANQDAKQDYWISILITAILILPMIALYCRLIKLYPGENLFDMLFDIFGTVLGRILSLIFVLYSLFIGSSVLATFLFFIQVTDMPETPTAAISFFFVIISILATRSGAEAIARVSSRLFRYISITVYFATLVCISNMKLANIQPIMSTAPKNVLLPSFNLLILPFAEIFICLPFFANLDRKENVKKIFIKALVLSIVMFLTVVIRNILILGKNAPLYYSPSYAAISIASIGEFFSRFEILVGMVLVLAGSAKICICTFTSAIGLSKIVKVDYKTVVVLCVLIIFTMSQNAFANATSALGYVKYQMIFGIPFELFLPVVIWIVAEIKNHLKSEELKSNNPGS